MKTSHFFSFLVLLLLIHPWHVQAENGAEQLFNEAGSAYSKGDYGKAGELYEKITEVYGFSPSVLYNLANSYAASDRIGKAILNYERAARLAPGDSDIINNLQVVKTREGLFDHEQSIQDMFISMLSINQWSLLGFFALAVIAVVMLLRLQKPVSRITITALNSLCVLMVIVSVYCVYGNYRAWAGYIVITPDSRLMISPFTGAASAGDIKAGRKVYILEKHRDFIYVRDEGGRKGWLPENVLEPIIPPG
ncbi:tetratricopeptide repeat protein [Desulfopila sp. IMCC35008]|uniref:tetratricopeptide repeat protein n=1 Tax=Desulfopila sp. IMCC35008 TaxID=2653858 RepID=UPI0013CFE839|nr:tetratricopeptide repeat protein [Desulfopila sp. IMCC35008]